MSSGRRFSESEILAHTRNRREEKALKSRIEKINEERGFFHDFTDKERKKIINFRKDNRRSSGMSPFSFNEEDMTAKTTDPTLMKRFSKPWAICPSETTFNTIYREASSTDLAQIALARKAREDRQKQRNCRNSSKTSSRTSSYDDYNNIDRKSVVRFSDEKSLSGVNENLTQVTHYHGNESSNAAQVSDNKSPRIVKRKRKTHMKTSVTRSKNFPEEQSSVNNNNGDIDIHEKDLVRTMREKGGKKQSELNEEKAESKNITLRNENAIELQNAISDKSLTYNENNTTKHHSKVIASVDVSNQMQNIDDHTNETESFITKSISSDRPVDANKNIKTIDKEDMTTHTDTKMRYQNGTNLNTSIFSMKLPSLPESKLSRQNMSFDEHEQDDCENSKNVEESILESKTLIRHDHTPVINSSSHPEPHSLDVVRPVTAAHAVVMPDNAKDNGTLDIDLPSRPYTVAGGEVLDFDLFTNGDDGSSLYHKGRKLRNYVPPQQRYKNDPFKTKRRERLITKVGKDNPDWVETHRKEVEKCNFKFSKATRERVLKQLVDENSLLENKKRLERDDGKFDDKIKTFLGSVDYLLHEPDERSRARHPLLA